jgi:hypothetical protein
VSDLDDIAESIGTIEEEQDADSTDRVQDPDSETWDGRDVQTEYDGGWSTDH